MPGFQLSSVEDVGERWRDIHRRSKSQIEEGCPNGTAMCAFYACIRYQSIQKPLSLWYFRVGTKRRAKALKFWFLKGYLVWVLVFGLPVLSPGLQSPSHGKQISVVGGGGGGGGGDAADADGDGVLMMMTMMTKKMVPQYRSRSLCFRIGGRMKVGVNGAAQRNSTGEKDNNTGGKGNTYYSKAARRSRGRKRNFQVYSHHF